MNSCRLSVALRPSTLFRFVLAALLTFALVPHLAFGQQTLGSLSGRVTDPSGAVVQKATIKIRDAATNLTAPSALPTSLSEHTKSRSPRMVSRPPSITRFWCRATGR